MLINHNRGKVEKCCSTTMHVDVQKDGEVESEGRTDGVREKPVDGDAPCMS